MKNSNSINPIPGVKLFSKISAAVNAQARKQMAETGKDSVIVSFSFDLPMNKSIMDNESLSDYLLEALMVRALEDYEDGRL